VNGRKCVLKHRPSKAKIRRINVRSPVAVPANCSVYVYVKLSLSDHYAVAADCVNKATELRPKLLVARTLMPDRDNFAAVLVINVSGRQQFLRSDLCLGSAVPGECLNNDIQAKTLAQNISLMADGQQCVDVTCETCMCDFSIGGVGRMASDGRGVTETAGAAVASAGPVAHPTPAQEDIPVPSDQLCGQPRCAAVECQPKGSVDAQTRLCDDLSGKSEGKLYAMFDADFVHVKPIFNNFPADTGSEEKRKVEELIARNADVSSMHEYDLGVTSLASHHIDTGNHPPILEPIRRHPKIYFNVIDDLINRLVDAGICEPCNSSWAANIVLAKKKDSAVLHVTVDFRKLNEATVKDKFPLPRISDCLDALSSAVYFSSIDQRRRQKQNSFHYASWAV